MLAVLAVAAGGAATDAQPRGTATTGTLAFHRSISLSGDTGGPFLDDIYTMNADGTRMRNLTRNRVRVHAWAPAWSPDGARIAFLRRIDGRRRDAVVVMNADGSEPRQVTETTLGDFGAVALSWAPGGRRIAFVRNGGIWVVRADGSARRRLIRDAGQPAWSPDGSTIAFVRKLRDDDSSAEIFVANPDGTGQRRLTRNSYGETAPAWSPTGDRIAFGRYGVRHREERHPRDAAERHRGPESDPKRPGLLSLVVSRRAEHRVLPLWGSRRRRSERRQGPQAFRRPRPLLGGVVSEQLRPLVKSESPRRRGLSNGS